MGDHSGNLEARMQNFAEQVDALVANAGRRIEAIVLATERRGREAQEVMARMQASLREDVFTERLRAYIWPQGIGQPADDAHLASVLEWMRTHLPHGLPIQMFLNAGTFADQRRQAVGDLRIP